MFITNEKVYKCLFSLVSMITKDVLKSIVKSQREELNSMEIGVERERIKNIQIDIPFAIIISGVRRCGKSTILKQIMKKLKNYYYFNFEELKATNFEVEDFQRLENVFLEEYGDCKYYFFDEIQNIEKWEIFVRGMLDKGKHFIITGSNASLLSKELGTKLTGRHIRQELFPFSFKEFLRFTNKQADINSFEEYFTNGGFPEYLKIGKTEILQELVNDILIRDIAIRHKIRNIKVLKEMAIYLLTNTGKEFSYNRLKKLFKLGSINSVISYTSYFEDSYLLFFVPKFDYSFKKQIINPKKVYAIDSGLVKVNSASFSEDAGRILENLVFLNLMKKYRKEDIFYFQDKNECDFVIKEKTKISKAIQVCYELNEEDKEREINGLIEALEKFNLKAGMILTYNQEDEIKIKDKKIIIKPVWKWLLEI